MQYFLFRTSSFLLLPMLISSLLPQYTTTNQHSEGQTLWGWKPHTDKVTLPWLFWGSTVPDLAGDSAGAVTVTCVIYQITHHPRVLNATKGICYRRFILVLPPSDTVCIYSKDRILLSVLWGSFFSSLVFLIILLFCSWHMRSGDPWAHFFCLRTLPASKSDLQSLTMSSLDISGVTRPSPYLEP